MRNSRPSDEEGLSVTKLTALTETLTEKNYHEHTYIDDGLCFVKENVRVIVDS